jgi:hypothetical protein
METIDRAEFDKRPFVMNKTSAVSIKAESGKVVGRLLHVMGDGTDAPVEIKKFPEK